MQALHERAFHLVTKELNQKKKLRQLSSTLALNSKRQIDLDLRSQGFLIKETIPFVMKLLKTVPRLNLNEQNKNYKDQTLEHEVIKETERI